MERVLASTENAIDDGVVPALFPEIGVDMNLGGLLEVVSDSLGYVDGVVGPSVVILQPVLCPVPTKDVLLWGSRGMVIGSSSSKEEVLITQVPSYNDIVKKAPLQTFVVLVPKVHSRIIKGSTDETNYGLKGILDASI